MACICALVCPILLPLLWRSVATFMNLLLLMFRSWHTSILFWFRRERCGRPEKCRLVGQADLRCKLHLSSFATMSFQHLSSFSKPQFSYLLDRNGDSYLAGLFEELEMMFTKLCRTSWLMGETKYRIITQTKALLLLLFVWKRKTTRKEVIFSPLYEE